MCKQVSVFVSTELKGNPSYLFLNVSKISFEKNFHNWLLLIISELNMTSEGRKEDFHGKLILFGSFGKGMIRKKSLA